MTPHEELEQRVSELEKKTDNRPKAKWDKASVASKLIVPILVAIFGGYITFLQIQMEAVVQQNNTALQKQLADAEASLQYDIAIINDVNEDLSRKLAERDVNASEARVLQLFIPHLIEGNDRERSFALALLNKFDPQVGEEAAKIFAYSEYEDDIKAQAEAVAKRISRETVSLEISGFVGGWPLIRGDTDMDTDGVDKVPVKFLSNLKVEGQQVVLEGTFETREMGGDKTTFSGRRQVAVYKAPPGRKILFLEAEGGLLARFNTVTIGKQRGFKKFSVDGTYWKSLHYQVDSKGSDDNVVGVKGNIVFVVVYQNEKK